MVDFKRFEDELYTHGMQAFRRIRELRPGHKFYCFAFFTSGEFGYMGATASSYQGLEEVARRYKAHDGYQDRPLDQLRKELKWSPVDSPLHTDPGGILDAVQATMDQVAAELDSSYKDDGEWENFEIYVARIKDSITNALRRLDRDGIFGQGQERTQVVVNLLMGDQTHADRIEFARKVNPPESVQMLINDLAA